MGKDKLIDVLQAHKKWLNGETGGVKANLRGADLRGANLYGADLCEANLYGANLRGADLREANLYEVNLRGANLREADLCGANLYGADLCGADLYGANLREANLCEANLYGANLRGADLCEANLCGANNYWLQCPETGSFIAYKKANGRIVKLEIPASASRSSATSRKCRCSKAKVLGITNLDGSKTDITQVCSNYDPNFIYTVGQTVEVPDFDTNRWNECSTGIHFFITRQEAVDY